MCYFTYGSNTTDLNTTAINCTSPGATEQHTCTHALIESLLWETPPKLHCHPTMEFQQGQNYMYCILLCCGTWRVVQVCPGMYYISFTIAVQLHDKKITCQFFTIFSYLTRHALKQHMRFRVHFHSCPRLCLCLRPSPRLSPAVPAFSTYPVKQLMSTLLNHPAVWCCVPIG